ncbi:unnamed protein product [Cylicocyclus nassatus]|uniref:Uncharacterized protein n=1 Tax=Cylicocyclus nassatus TaxID=53992 RepID=A0AA36GJB1_CYLNA|nr:unnamed protein product [Cylicocyclus nassatus]
MKALCMSLIIILYASSESSSNEEAKKMDRTRLNRNAGNYLTGEMGLKATPCTVLSDGARYLISALYLWQISSGFGTYGDTALLWETFPKNQYFPRSVKILLKRYREDITKWLEGHNTVQFGCDGRRNRHHPGINGTIACVVYMSENCKHPNLDVSKSKKSDFGRKFQDHLNFTGIPKGGDTVVSAPA